MPLSRLCERFPSPLLVLPDTRILSGGKRLEFPFQLVVVGQMFRGHPAILDGGRDGAPWLVLVLAIAEEAL